MDESKRPENNSLDFCEELLKNEELLAEFESEEELRAHIQGIYNESKETGH